jgi:hypothetical protein
VNRGWQILSVHFPGAQGGLSVSAYGKTRGWVPDLLALKCYTLLTVESKAHYTSSDVDKLDEMLSDQKIVRKLKLKLNLTEGTICQKAIAFHALSFEQNDVPSDFVVFVTKDKSEISTYFGQRVTDSIKNAFKS